MSIIAVLAAILLPLQLTAIWLVFDARRALDKLAKTNERAIGEE
jgi:hypothetical protein